MYRQKENIQFLSSITGSVLAFRNISEISCHFHPASQTLHIREICGQCANEEAVKMGISPVP